MRLTSFHVRAIAFLTLGAALAAAAAPKVHAEAQAEVKMERIKPEREKYETVRFLKQNRDFVRRRFDLLREKPVGASGDAGPIDPRYLEYSKMLAAVLADRDSVTRAAEARDRLTLLASITELGQLETQLDQMDRLLAAQRGRLGILQNDFTGRQQTALVVVASGWPAGATVDSITIALEDGSHTTVTLTDAQRASLRDGGVLQLFHGFVEPRVQAFELTLAGNRWAAPAPAWVTLDPARDRITFLKLDLSTVAQGGAADMSARTWIHDESLPPGDS